MVKKNTKISEKLPNKLLKSQIIKNLDYSMVTQGKQYYVIHKYKYKSQGRNMFYVQL